MSLQDLRDDLESEIVVDDEFRLNKPKAINKPELEDKEVNDIFGEGEDIDVSGRKFLGVYKSKTKNFDSLGRNKKLKDIDLQGRKPFQRFYENKPKLSLLSKLKISKKLQFRNSFAQKLVVLGILFVFLGVILKFSIEYSVHTGYNRLISLKENNQNFTETQKVVNNAKFDFIIADILFKPLLFIPNHNIENAYHIIKGGKEITKLGDSILQLYTALQSFASEKGIENIIPTNLILNHREELSNTENLLSKALFHYDQIENIGNTDLEDKISNATDRLKDVLSYLHTININFDTFLSILGHKERKEYLVVFQNNDEIRPTGGFMGSLGVISVYKGKIIDFQKSDIYAYEWEINQAYEREELVKTPAPKGLNQLTGTFGLRDANYYVDFDKSSKSIENFLDTLDKKVDGVVYINQNVILDLLKITGGVQLDSISQPLTDENFSLLISTLVEAKTFKVGALGTPKKILFDFAEKFSSVLKGQKDYFGYVSVIIKHIRSRDIVFYSYNPEENSALWKLGVNGHINYNNTIDFSYPVYTSLSGNKSDRYIQRKYKKDTTIHSDCSISNTLTMELSHHFTKEDEKGLNIILDEYKITNKDHIQYIQGRGDNYQFMRMVLPKNSIVTPQDGLEVKQYKDYKIGEFFLRTRRFETSSYSIEYMIPNKTCKTYGYRLYKQPGIASYDMESIVDGEKTQFTELEGDFYIN